MAVETIELTGSALTGIAPSAELTMSTAAVTSLSVKLGRRQPKARSQCLRFGVYLQAVGATPPPTRVDYAAKAMPSMQRMYLNDTYGDCVIAGKYHAEGIWSGNDSNNVVLGADQEVYAAYQTICGPGDNGCVITEVLDYFRDRGLKFNGAVKKIDGYVWVDWKNKLEVQVALYLFGAITIGFKLPFAWKSSAIWDVTESGIAGGHDVTCVGYNEQGVQVSSWGRIYTITWAAFTSARWLDESYVMLAPDWYGNDQLAPSGVDVAMLRDDLQKLGGGTIPPINPSPVPPPSPTPVPEPPAPAVAPNYAGKIDGMMNGPFGTHPFTGTISLAPVAAHATDVVVAHLADQLKGSSNWLAIVMDLSALMAAIREQNLAAITAAMQKLAADLGYALPTANHAEQVRAHSAK